MVLCQSYHIITIPIIWLSLCLGTWYSQYHVFWSAYFHARSQIINQEVVRDSAKFYATRELGWLCPVTPGSRGLRSVIGWHGPRDWHRGQGAGAYDIWRGQCLPLLAMNSSRSERGYNWKLTTSVRRTLIKNVPALGNIFDQSYNLHLSVWLRSEAWVGHGPGLLMISPGIFSIFRRILNLKSGP